MKHKVWGRVTIITLTLLLSLVYLLPSTPFYGAMPGWWKELMPARGITLGLDLQGGQRLVFEVDVERAVEIGTDRTVMILREEAAKKGWDVKIERAGRDIRVTPENADLALFVKNQYIPYDDKGGGLFVIQEQEAAQTRQNAMDQVLETIRNRIDQFGVAEPVIQRQGEYEFVVELPGIFKNTRPVVDATARYANRLTSEAQAAGILNATARAEELDILAMGADQAALDALVAGRFPELQTVQPGVYRISDKEVNAIQSKRAVELIGKTAQLEFKILSDQTAFASNLPGLITPEQEDTLIRPLLANLPEGAEILYERQTDPETGVEYKRPLLLDKETLLTGDLLTEARVSIDQRFGEPYVSIRFNAAGAQIFEQVTTDHVGDQMAIILDGNVYSYPRINEPISGGSAMISGNFTMEEARDLAIVLKAGALPAPVIMLQNVTVGPSLGADSIEAGKRAGLIGAAMVILFMIVYYKLSGFIADFAMVLNILLLLGAMSALGATFTLPGIAGVILAVGMAVDSNVLMFERMREEIRLGKTPRSAVDSGYDKAFWTIFDSHVTTFITAVVLFQFGTGPIKGFAVTLSLGVAINLFTALVVTKTIFDIINSRREVRSLSI